MITSKILTANYAFGVEGKDDEAKFLRLLKREDLNPGSESLGEELEGLAFVGEVNYGGEFGCQILIDDVQVYDPDPCSSGNIAKIEAIIQEHLDRE